MPPKTDQIGKTFWEIQPKNKTKRKNWDENGEIQEEKGNIVKLSPADV